MDLGNLRLHLCTPFHSAQQQDAEEFLGYVLDYLERSCGCRHFTAWPKLLQGVITGTTQCNCCANVTSRVDQFTALKVAFPDSSRASLVNITDLLGSTFASVPLVGENQYACDSCNESGRGLKQDAVRTTCFSTTCPDCTLPCYSPTLLLSFGRFKLNTFTGARTKILTPVNFGRTLELQDRVVYDLVGIMVHDGTTDVSGHYYAYLRFENKELEPSWFLFNDDVVRRTSDIDINAICTGKHKPSATPYILSYQCRQTVSSASRCACRHAS